MELFHDAARTNQHLVADLAVGNHRVRANPAVRADLRLSDDLHERLDHRIRADLDIGIDVAGLGTEDRGAGLHQFARFFRPQLGVEFRQLHARVHTQHFIRILGAQREHLVSRLAQHARHVGEVKLAGWIVGGELVDVCVQRPDRKGIDAGVDLALFAFVVAQGLLFDDAIDFVGWLGMS